MCLLYIEFSISLRQRYGDEEKTDRLGKELEGQDSVTLKRKKPGRKSWWPEEVLRKL